MAATQSSQEKWRSRDRQRSTTSRSYRRSKSRRIPDPQSAIKSVSPQTSHCRHTVGEGDFVRIFSQTANTWVDGEVVELVEGSFVLVHYKIDHYCFRKIVHTKSEHLDTLSHIASRLEANTISWDRNIPELTSGKPPGLVLMQGCRDSLPVSPEQYFLTQNYMFDMLKQGYVALIRGQWLLDCYRKHRPLPRRQDLPSEAIWDANDLIKACGSGDAEIVSISHCWLTRDHPDPTGIQVQDVGVYLSDRLTEIELYRLAPHRCSNPPTAMELWYNHEFRGELGPGPSERFDFAIFWCWCSFFQEPRTADEQSKFARAMEHMDLWYINACTEVWILPDVPEDAINKTGYCDRGWTSWELRAAQMLHRQSRYASDESVNDMRHQNTKIIVIVSPSNNWGDYGRSVKPWKTQVDKKYIADKLDASKFRNLTAEELPLDPDEFECLIDTNIFTKGLPDIKRVKDNYRKNFEGVMSVLRFLEFEVRVCPRDIHKLLKLLPLCNNLQRLVIGGFPVACLHGLPRHPVDELVDALPLCPKLSFLDLTWGIGFDVDLSDLYEKKISLACERLDIELGAAARRGQQHDPIGAGSFPCLNRAEYLKIFAERRQNSEQVECISTGTMWCNARLNGN